MTEFFDAVSSFVIGFFLFILRSPASAAWAQSFAIVTTGIFAFYAARKAYNGAVVQAKAAQKSAEATLFIHETEKKDRRDGTCAALLAEISAMMLNLQTLYNRSLQKPETFYTSDGRIERIRFRDVLEITKTSFPIFQHNPYAVAVLGSEPATSIIMFYDEYLAAVQGAQAVTDNNGMADQSGSDYIRKHTKRLLSDGAEILRLLVLTMPSETQAQWNKWRQRVDVPDLQTITFD